MEWIERRDGDFLASRNGKVLGRVTQGIGTIWAATAGGADLGEYISNQTARAAVEAHVRETKMAEEG